MVKITKEFYTGKDSYMLFGVESTFGTATPDTQIEKLQDVSFTMNQNLLKNQGIGDGADAKDVHYGNFDVSGSINVKPTNFHFMNFSSGSVDGAGTAGDPYLIVDADNIGYSGTFIRTGTLEIDNKGLSNHQRMRITGCSYGSWGYSGNQGEDLSVSADFTGKTVKRDTTLTGYTAGGVKTFIFNSGSVGWNDETLNCTQFSVNVDYPSNYPREVFNRFVKQPTKNIRGFNWTLTLNKQYDNTANVISGVELMNEFFGKDNMPASDGTPTGRDMHITVDEGSAAGNKVMKLQFADSFINDWAENPSLEGGVVSVTVNGFSLSGQTLNGNKTHLLWWTK